MATTTTEEDTETSSDPAVTWLEGKAKQFSDEADKLRATTDRAAKALGALATSGLTAIGIAKFADIFPLPSGEWPWLVPLFVGFFAMVVSVVAFVYRFWRANRPLALSTSLTDMWPGKENGNLRDKQALERNWYKRFVDGDLTDIDKAEHDEIQRVYKDALKHAPFAEGVIELEKYEENADKLERDALYTPASPISKRDMPRVFRMRAEIERAKERAKLVVVRRRMNHVFNRPAAAILASAFVLGLVAFAIAADHLEAERSEPAMTACTEAIDAAGTNLSKVPGACLDVVD